LFGIKRTRDHIESNTGLLGQVAAYYGVVEAQGRGSLHVHMLLWLKNTPNADELQVLLKKMKIFGSESFNICLQTYELMQMDSPKTLFASIEREPQLAYSRPLDPYSPHWKEECMQLERRVVRSQQIHTCTTNTCLRLNRYGRVKCKRRAPWPLSNRDRLDETGRWFAKRFLQYLNTYCPPITLTLKCNNDIKLITNGSETKDAAWYCTTYQTKKQQKSYNTSALMAKTLLYHNEHSEYIDDLRDRNRLLLFRCYQNINNEVELSGQQIMRYLMGKGDTFRSHHYPHLYWSSLANYLLKHFPNLRRRKYVWFNTILCCFL
jgi:hypothetical protein